MPKATYTASFAAYDICGGGTGTPGEWCEVEIPIHVWCNVASTSPGSAVQVDLTWDDGNGPLVENIILSLDAINTAGDLRHVRMWTGYNTTVSLQATLLGDGQFGIDWEQRLYLVG
jgi:hypothetical protein